MSRIDDVFTRCRQAIPAWRGRAIDEFDFDDPKGFSSFTMGVRHKSWGAPTGVAAPDNQPDPPAVLYRHLDGKENAILDSATERRVFLLLGDAEIAARCFHYDDTCRIEQFYRGRTLTADDVFDTDIQRKVTAELYRMHQIQPQGLPDGTFFELLHAKWGAMARDVLINQRDRFPEEERHLCDDLVRVYASDTLEMVRRCLPDRAPVFCHNDTYHGNVFLLDDGSVKLLDFEFSCLNHVAFDFANLFAETVMVHGLVDPPHFDIAPPRWTDGDLATFVGYYLDNSPLVGAERALELERLVAETKRALLLSDYMYTMAALPLALEPIQKIRFLPYAHRRFHKFLDAWASEFTAA